MIGTNSIPAAHCGWIEKGMTDYYDYIWLFNTR